MIHIDDLAGFQDKNILIIGDLMLDEYIYGTIDRISPEAPVPILLKKQKKTKLGGAANVAMNIKSLGSKPYLISVVGDDKQADTARKLLEEGDISSYLINDDSRPTTTKTRMMTGGYQVMRVDEESDSDIDTSVEVKVLNAFKNYLHKENIAGVILQDYNKGVLTHHIIEQVISQCNKVGIPTFVDPKANNFFSFKNCTIFKPNKKELLSAIMVDNSDFKSAIVKAYQLLQSQVIFCTLSAEGIAYLDEAEYKVIPTSRIEVVDVSGAGDTSLAVIALGYISGFSNEDIATLANIAGGLACRKAEVSDISLNELKNVII